MLKLIYSSIFIYLSLFVYEIHSFPWQNFFIAESGNPEQNITLPELLKSEHEFIFYKALERLGLLETLSSEGITVFGPTDEAFRKIPRIFQRLMYRNRTFYEQVLKFHVINDTVYSSDLSNNLLLDSLEGQPVRINTYKDGQVITASGAAVIKPDLNATNGVLHTVGKVMIPPFGDILNTLKLSQSFSLLVQAIESVNFTSDLTGNGTFTLFAPVNKAFKRIMPLPTNETELSNLLQYHVVSEAYYMAGFTNGQMITTENGNNITVSIRSRRWHRYEKETYINKAKILLADITCTNGVIHVIDEVLMPPKDENMPSFTVLKFRSLLQILGL